MRKQIIIIGHRGAKGYQPENTMASFDYAMKLGCDFIELDVHMSSGKLFVIHDSEVDRTTNGTGNIATLSLAEIEKLDAGNGEKIPELREVLNLVSGRCGVNVELKGIGTAEPVSDLLNIAISGGADPSDYLVSSFNHKELSLVHKNFRRGILFDKLPADWADRSTGVGAWSINLAKSQISSEIIQHAQKKGFKVLAYTANSPNDIRTLIRAGVDGIFSDFPDRVVKQIHTQ